MLAILSNSAKSLKTIDDRLMQHGISRRTFLADRSATNRTLTREGTDKCCVALSFSRCYC